MNIELLCTSKINLSVSVSLPRSTLVIHLTIYAKRIQRLKKKSPYLQSLYIKKKYLKENIYTSQFNLHIGFLATGSHCLYDSFTSPC